jgi:OOP family OmpA-OmpF porin
MKKIIFIFLISLLVVSCTKPNYREEKKIVIRKKPKLILKLTLNVGANFDFDKAILKNKDIPKLNEFIEQIKNLHGTLTIVGHTDTNGSYAYNDKLSFKRAMAIRNYMAKKLDFNNYETKITGMGEREPIYKPEKSIPEMAANRRVEITFVEDDK